VLENWRCQGGTVVELSNQNPKMKGSNPATGKGREKMVKNNKIQKKI
jgi:hypothetical protein